MSRDKCVAGGAGDCLTAHAAASSPVSPPPFMAGIAEVEVEKATGKVSLVDYVGVVDCGTIVNTAPAIASAVAHATGAYVREPPITPEKVLLAERP